MDSGFVRWFFPGLKDFDPSQQRDDSGKWSETGAGGSGQSSLGKNEKVTREKTYEFNASDIKPTKSPKFSRASQNDALTAATSASLYDGRTRYVYASQGGFQVTTQKPTLPGGNRYTAVDSKREGDKVKSNLRMIEVGN